MANIFSKFYELLEADLDSRLNTLKKTDMDASPSELLFKGERADGTVGRKGLIFDPFFDSSYSAGMFKPKSTYLSPIVLKQITRKNALVASFIDVRASQVSAACRKQTSRFDIGFKIQPKDQTKDAEPEEIRKIEEFILNCGYNNDRPTEDKMTFDQWGYMVTRDFMTVGHSAIEKVRRRDGALYSFLPLPAETVYYANKKMDKRTIDSMRMTYQKTMPDREKLDLDRVARGDYEFVQVVEGKVTEGFTEDEMIFAKMNLESDVDLNGYCIGPLERALSAVISHMQVENHQRQFFTHGAASKGLLVIQGDVAPASLKTLQNQWSQQIAGPFSAWRTPILAGIKGVQWVPLAASNRDMEYAAWQDYLIRVMCSSMGVSPEEIGFDYLARGTEQRSMSESSNEWKLTASRDRGLRPILGRIESIINEEILPAFHKGFSEKYHFSFVGLDAESRTEEIQRLQAEVSLHTTLNEAREQAQMEPLEVGGDLILNPTLVQALQGNMYKGEFMERFMGVQGAAQRPDLQYIPDPLWFQWQQLQMQMSQQQAGAQPGEAPPQDPNAPQDPNDPQSAPGTEQDAMKQQQMGAIEQYMAQNPELFKFHKENLTRHEELKKAEKAAHQVNVEHVDKMKEKLVKDIRKAGEMMMKEIFEIVADDKLKKGK